MIEPLVTYGQLLVGAVLAGMLGILWKDLREVRKGVSGYVKQADCNEKRQGCASMRDTVGQIIQEHSLSLRTMQDLLRVQSECLARLDERVRFFLGFKNEAWEAGSGEKNQDNPLP